MLLKAQIFEQKKQFETAAELYGKLIDIYPEDILADNALYQLAQLNQFKLNLPQKAQANYEMLIVNYTQSLFVAEARVQFRKLRGF
jgi:tetratricopeptide (TPR) repeat protein